MTALFCRMDHKDRVYVGTVLDLKFRPLKRGEDASLGSFWKDIFPLLLLVALETLFITVESDILIIANLILTNLATD